VFGNHDNKNSCMRGNDRILRQNKPNGCIREAQWSNDLDYEY